MATIDLFEAIRVTVLPARSAVAPLPLDRPLECFPPGATFGLLPGCENAAYLVGTLISGAALAFEAGAGAAGAGKLARSPMARAAQPLVGSSCMI